MSSHRSSPWLSLILTIIIPAIILAKLSQADRLGPIYNLLIALSFPIIYSFYVFYQERNISFIAAIGFIGILLTGAIGLLKLDANLIAIKEASIPLFIGLAIIVTRQSKYSIVDNLLKQILDVNKIKAAMLAQGNNSSYVNQTRVATYLIASSFFLSAFLNWLLAKIIIKSQPGTIEFNVELGKMTALSYPVIMVPSFLILIIAITYLLKNIGNAANLDIKSIIKQP